MAPRFVARQLSHPSGYLGPVIRRLMNWHNADMNAFAVRVLDPSPVDRILEIGFGGGVALRALIKHARFVAGVDRSRDVVAAARAAFSLAIADGRADFREGSVEALPFSPASFTKICTVNTIYFWKTLDAGFGEIHRVLGAGGRLAVGFLPEEHMARMMMPPDIFRLCAPDHVTAALARSGFRDIRVRRPAPETRWNVIEARRA